MEEAFQNLVRHGYLVLFLWLLVKQAGVPVPGTPILLAAGALVGAGKLGFVPALAVTLAASTVGDSLWYALGRWRGLRVLKFFCRVALEPDYCVRKTQNAFARRGAWLLLYAKFLPGLSAVAQPLAGIEGIKPARFLVLNSLGTLLHGGFFIALGLAFSDQLEAVAARLAETGKWFAVLLAAFFTAYLGWKFFERRRFIRSLRGARITPSELKNKLDSGEDVFVIDLRRRIEFDDAPEVIPGALHVVAEELDDRQHEIPRNRSIVLYCT